MSDGYKLYVKPDDDNGNLDLTLIPMIEGAELLSFTGCEDLVHVRVSLSREVEKRVGFVVIDPPRPVLDHLDKILDGPCTNVEITVMAKLVWIEPGEEFP